MLVCSKCGSRNIQILAWINPNTNELKQEEGITYENMWCEDCQDNTFLIDADMYIKWQEDREDELFYDEMFG